MKRAVNFRLSSQTLAALSRLEKKMHLSKTAVIEKAILFYVKKELSNQSHILEFAGMLSDKEADLMLKAIETTKHNKDIDIDL